MLINPEKNTEFKKFLDELYEKIDFLLPRLTQKRHIFLDEFKWAIATDYILLKSLGENELSKYLYEKDPSLWDEFKYHSDFKLNDESSRELRRLTPTFKELYYSFFENFLINPYVFRNSLFTMRIDRELKILFNLFGGKFLPQEQEIWDGTGALYFMKKDFKTDSEDFNKKIEILQNHLENKEFDEFGCIALNIGHHWVAVNSINEDLVSFNDPNTGGKGKIKINKKIPEHYRFYFFSYNPETAIILDEKIKKFLDVEIEKELHQIQEFTRGLVEKIEREPDFISLRKRSSQEIKEPLIKNGLAEKPPLEPKPKENVMDRIKKKIRDSFSDYSKL